MSPLRIYRFSIWLPLLVPAVVIVAMNSLTSAGMPKPSGRLDVVLETIAWSGLFGGLPYLALALWATWWIRGRTERQIRRLMFVAPLLMVVVFTVVCLIMGLIADRMELWTRIAWELSVIILLLGYGYVALTLLLRYVLTRRAAEALKIIGSSDHRPLGHL